MRFFESEAYKCLSLGARSIRVRIGRFSPLYSKNLSSNQDRTSYLWTSLCSSTILSEHKRSRFLGCGATGRMRAGWGAAGSSSVRDKDMYLECETAIDGVSSGLAAVVTRDHAWKRSMSQRQIVSASWHGRRVGIGPQGVRMLGQSHESVHRDVLA